MTDFSKPFAKMAETIDRNKAEVSGAFVISLVQGDGQEPIVISAMLTDMKDPVAILSLINGQIQVTINQLDQKLHLGYGGR